MGWTNNDTQSITVPPQGGSQRIVIGPDDPFAVAAGAVAAIMFYWMHDEAFMLDVLLSGSTGQLRLSNTDATGITAQFWNCFYDESTGVADLTLGDVTTNSVEIVSSDFLIDSVSQGRGNRTSGGINSNSGAISGETVVLTIPSADYLAGRAFEVKVGGRVQASATNTAVFKLRFGNTVGGQLVATLGGVSVNTSGATGAANVSLARYLIRDAGDGDLTTGFCVTMLATTGTDTLLGATNEPAFVEITDVGFWTDFIAQGIFL